MPLLKLKTILEVSKFFLLFYFVCWLLQNWHKKYHSFRETVFAFVSGVRAYHAERLDWYAYYTVAQENITFGLGLYRIFASAPNSGPNRLFVFGRIVLPRPNTNSAWLWGSFLQSSRHWTASSVCRLSTGVSVCCRVSDCSRLGHYNSRPVRYGLMVEKTNETLSNLSLVAVVEWLSFRPLCLTINFDVQLLLFSNYSYSYSAE